MAQWQSVSSLWVWTPVTMDEIYVMLEAFM